MNLVFLSFAVSFILTLLVKLVAQKNLLIDIPNERSSHSTPTPTGGGIAIAITWFVAISYLKYIELLNSDLYWALLSGLIICVISLIDDIYEIKPLPRIIIQTTSAIIALYFIGGLQQLDIGIYVLENELILSLIAVLGIVWFVNLFNFIDGIDGYAASETIFVAISMYFFINNIVLLVFATCILGFLPWNWDKAKIFMGDVGSTLLGFTICILAIYYNNIGEFPLINSIILTSLFWFDATITLLKRFINKENLGKAHKKHAYQRIVASGFSHQKTVIIGMGINLLLFSIVLIIPNSSYALVAFIFACLVLYGVYQSINNKQPFL